MSNARCDEIFGDGADGGTACEASNVPSASYAIDVGGMEVKWYGVFSNEVVLKYFA